MSELKRRKVSIQFERRNVEILKRRINHFKHLPMYQAIAYVLLGTAKKKELYSLEEWGVALFEIFEKAQYLDPISGKLSRSGYGALEMILNKLRKNGYKKSFDMFKPFCLEFEDPLGIKDSQGRFPIHALLAPLRKHKDMDVILKKHNKAVNGLMRGISEIELMKSTDIRKLNKKLEKLALEGEGEMIIGNKKGSKQ
jgi:hypothetical protein